MTRFRREADVHRTIMLRRGTGVASEWKQFRQFLLDVGPCPDDHELIPFFDHEKSFGPGRVRWAPRGTKPKVTLKAAPPASASTGGYGQWTTLGGQTVSYSKLSDKLNTPLQPILQALNTGATADGVAREVRAADALVNDKAIWLPGDEKRREGFFMAFRAWRLQVRPELMAHATPAFLFLYSVLPVMRDSRDELMRLDLWKPLTHSKWSAREAHIAWKRYCEMYPRAQTAMAEVRGFSSYSVESELDLICTRIVEAEKKMRAVKPSAPQAAASPTASAAA
jgi:hypothetical protein